MSIEKKQLVCRGVAVVVGERVVSVFLTKGRLAGDIVDEIADDGAVPPVVSRQRFTRMFFAPGDAVRVRTDAATIVPSFGSPAARMLSEAKVGAVGKNGIVVCVCDNGDVEVPRGCYWPPDWLEKVCNGELKIGDKVVCDRVHETTVTLRWDRDMTARLGQIGTVTGVDKDGDIDVRFGDRRTWMYDKTWLRLATPQEVAGHALLEPALAALREANADPDAIAELIKRQLKRPRTE